MRANRYSHIAVIGATLLFLVLWQTAVAGPPEKPGNPGLPGCLARVSELNDIVANQQETIDQQAARIEELEDMLENFAPVPQTGQKWCWEYDVDDDWWYQTECEGTGQDGELQMGVQWPDPRFSDNDNGTVTDNLSGLIWLKNNTCFGQLDWQGALTASNNLADGDCGLGDGSKPSDWRLPNVNELHSLWLANFQSDDIVFEGIEEDYNWTSTTNHFGTPDDAMIVNPSAFVEARPIQSAEGKQSLHWVWPVRGGN
jgi:hypothetical protein